MMSSKICTQSRLAYLSVMLFIALIACIGIVVWLGITRPQQEKAPDALGENATVQETVKYLRKTFPGYFFTPEEQQYLIANESKTETVLKPANVSTSNCSMPKCNYFPYKPNPEQNQPARRRRSTPGVVYHGCCETIAVYTAPTALPNLQIPPIIRKLPQFPQNAQQVFKTEQCGHVKGCTGCQCIQDPKYFAAVYERDPGTYNDISDKYAIDWFQLPGCCRCRNIA